MIRSSLHVSCSAGSIVLVEIEWFWTDDNTDADDNDENDDNDNANEWIRSFVIILNTANGHLIIAKATNSF